MAHQQVLEGGGLSFPYVIWLRWLAGQLRPRAVDCFPGNKTLDHNVFFHKLHKGEMINS